MSPYESSGSDGETIGQDGSRISSSAAAAPKAGALGKKMLAHLQDGAHLVSPSPQASRQSMHIVEVDEEDDSSD